MHIHDELRPVVAEGARRAAGEETRRNGSQSGRFSAQRKAEVVLRLLRGDD
jgi:hypothetical protein